MIALGAGGGMQFPSWSVKENKTQDEAIIQNWHQIMSEYGAWIWVGITMIILIILTIWILRTIGQAGIIRSLYQINKGEVTNFQSGFSQGKVYFWKIILTDIILSVFMILIAMVFAIPIIFLFIGKAYSMGIMLVLFALIIFIPIAAIAGFMRRYSYYYLVLSNLNIQPALENSYLVFKKNIIPSVVMVLIFIPISLIMVLAIVAALIAVGIVFVILGIIAHLIFSQIVLYIVIGLGVLIFIAIVIFLRSIFETFSQSAWFYFFQQIASEKKEEVAAEETSMVNENISEAGVYKVEEK